MAIFSRSGQATFATEISLVFEPRSGFICFLSLRFLLSLSNRCTALVCFVCSVRTYLWSLCSFPWIFFHSLFVCMSASLSLSICLHVCVCVCVYKFGPEEHCWGQMMHRIRKCQRSKHIQPSFGFSFEFPMLQTKKKSACYVSRKIRDVLEKEEPLHQFCHMALCHVLSALFSSTLDTGGKWAEKTPCSEHTASGAVSKDCVHSCVYCWFILRILGQDLGFIRASGGTHKYLRVVNIAYSRHIGCFITWYKRARNYYLSVPCRKPLPTKALVQVPPT